jgi:hypothetical protein
MPTGLTDVMCVSMASIPNGLAVTHEQIVRTWPRASSRDYASSAHRSSRPRPSSFDPDQFSQPPTTDGNGKWQALHPWQRRGLDASPARCYVPSWTLRCPGPAVVLRLAQRESQGRPNQASSIIATQSLTMDRSQDHSAIRTRRKSLPTPKLGLRLSRLLVRRGWRFRLACPGMMISRRLCRRFDWYALIS